MYKYEIPIISVLSDTIPSIVDLAKSLNENMSYFGFTEKLSIEGEIAVFSFTSDAILAADQLQTIHTAFESLSKPMFDKIKLKIGKIRKI